MDNLQKDYAIAQLEQALDAAQSRIEELEAELEDLNEQIFYLSARVEELESEGEK